MKKLFYLGLFSLLIVSCKTTPKESAEGTDANAVQGFAKSIAETSFDLRKPGDITDLLALSGTRFMPELVNDPMNHSNYLGSNAHTAANIGVYMVDALYQIAFDKDYEGYLSIAAAKQLAMAIGIGEIMNEIVLERYGDGEYPSDSILNTIRMGLERSELLLSEKDQAQIFAAMLVGNYIEKLHILFANIFEYPVELPEDAKLLVLRDLIVITGNQLELLPEAIEIVDKYKKNEEGFLAAELKDIQMLRVNYKFSDEDIAQLTPEMIFENQALLAMYEKIKAVRAYIVSIQ